MDATKNWWNKQVLEQMEDAGIYCDITVGEDGGAFVILYSWEQYEKLNIILSSVHGADIDLDAICAWGFSDEHSTCSNCYKAIRTAADSYDWQPMYHDANDGIYCRECVDPDDYVAGHINKAKLWNQSLVDPVAQGFAKLGYKYETGLHDYQNDEPSQILAIRRQYLPWLEVIFTGAPSQFDCAWNVWVRASEDFAYDYTMTVADVADVAATVLEHYYKMPSIGPSNRAKAALRAASTAMAAMAD